MKKLIAIALTLSLAACGWHLRGTLQVSEKLSPLYVSAVDSQGALMTELKSQLKSAHVILAEKKSDANFNLWIEDETKEKRTAGVGIDALSSAYEITFKVNFEIRAKNSDQVDKATAVSVRSYNYSTTAITSAAQEEVLLEKEMRREIAQQIVRRLNAFATHPQTPNNKPLPVQ